MRDLSKSGNPGARSQRLRWISAIIAGLFLVPGLFGLPVGSTAPSEGSATPGITTLRTHLPDMDVPTSRATVLNWTESSSADFANGTVVNIDRVSSPGNLTLLADPANYTKYAQNPVLAGGMPGSWDDEGDSAATVRATPAGYEMWFTGSAGNLTAIGRATSNSGTVWLKTGGSAVFVQNGTLWESSGVHDPTVLRDGATYHMWYVGQAGEIGAIGHATSPDGVNWTRDPVVNPVLTASVSGWDGKSLSAPMVIKDGGTFRMWYSGRSAAFGWRIGYATSADGTNWTKYASNPVLVPTFCSWDCLEVRSPEVVKDGNTLRMWYTGVGLGGNTAFGYATSADGVAWPKDSSNPVFSSSGAGWDASIDRPAVTKEGATYRMWYTGGPDLSKKIGLAMVDFRRPGSYTSRAFNSGSSGTTWGNLTITTITQPETDVRVATRSGNVPVPDASWSAWSAPVNASSFAITSPRARYLQYWANLTTTVPAMTPAVNAVAIEYRLDTNDVPLLAGPDPLVWLSSQTPTLSWTYRDAEGDAEFYIHVQVNRTADFTTPAVDQNIVYSATTWTSPSLKEGIWFWRLRTQDIHSIWSGFSVPSSFKLDLTPPQNPTLASTSHVPGFWSTNRTVEVSVTGGSDLLSGLADWSFVWDTKPTTLPDKIVDANESERLLVSPVLPEGAQNWFHLRGIDKAGNANATAVHLGPFALDASPPPNPATFVSVSHGVGFWSNRSVVTMNWSKAGDSFSGVGGYALLFDTAPRTVPPETVLEDANATEVASSPLADGETHYAHLRAVDRAGNWNATAVHAGPFGIDTTAPDVLSLTLEGGAATTPNRTIVATVVATDPLSGPRDASFRTDGGPWGAWIPLPGTPPTMNLTFYLPEDEGGHTVEVLVRDAAGNVGGPVNDTIEYRIPVPNQPPTWPPIPATNATIGTAYGLDLAASDPEGAGLTYALVTGPAGLNVSATGHVSWPAPGTDLAGKLVVVTVSANDGVNPPVTTTLTIKVRAIPYVTIASPDWYSKVKGTSVRVSGEARVLGSTIVLADIQIGSAARTSVTVQPDGTWSTTFDSTKLKNGDLHITVRVRSADGLESTDEVRVKVANGRTANSGGDLGMLVLLVLAVVAVLVVAGVARQRRSAGRTSSGPAGREDEKEDGAGGADQASGRVTAGATGGAVAAGASKPVAPAPVIATAAKGPNDGAGSAFAVEDVYLVYTDGRLIHHDGTARKGAAAKPDQDIVASMLTAIQSFIKDSLDRGGDSEIGSIEYGDRKILVERSAHLYLGLVIRGTPPGDVRDRMRGTVERIEGMHAGVIENWDGDTASMAQAKSLLRPLLLELRAEQRSAGGTARVKVSVKNALEFYQGYVRLKVGVRNEGSTTVTDASFKLTYDRKTLRIARVEPDYDREGTEVMLGNIEPGQKRSVAFYLDPIICTETPVDGTLLYKDFEGALHRDEMKRRVVDIVCPIFYTEQNVNAAMLKRLVGSMKYRDSRLYRWPSSISTEKAEEMSRAAIADHAVKFVRRFVEGEGAEETGAGPVKEGPDRVSELWFYGKVQTTGEEMVIRATVRDGKRTIEVFVASDNLVTITGLLAELGHNLTEHLRHIAPKAELARATQEEEEEVARTRSLLEKAADSELAASD